MSVKQTADPAQALEHKMIEPFTTGRCGGSDQYGVSSYGYDIRVADESGFSQREFDDRGPSISIRNRS